MALSHAKETGSPVKVTSTSTNDLQETLAHKLSSLQLLLTELVIIMIKHDKQLSNHVKWRPWKATVYKNIQCLI